MYSGEWNAYTCWVLYGIQYYCIYGSTQRNKGSRNHGVGVYWSCCHRDNMCYICSQLIRLNSCVVPHQNFASLDI
jgi:hypothetical protein